MKNIIKHLGIIAIAAVIGTVLAGCVSTGDTTPSPVYRTWQGDYNVVDFSAPSLPRGTIIHIGRDSITGEGLNITDVSSRGTGSNMYRGEPPHARRGESRYYVALGKSTVDAFLDWEGGAPTAESVIPDTTDMVYTYVGNLVPSGLRDPFLNGTWVHSSETGDNTLEYTFNRGNFSVSMNGSPLFRGSYSTSSILGSGRMTMIPTHREGDGENFPDLT